MREIELKPIADHLNPFHDEVSEKPNHVLIGKIRQKQKFLRSIEADNI